MLNSASLTIKRGSFTAVIGGNGCGKSTLCKLFNGLIPHYYSGDFDGDVKINGISAARKKVAELSRMVGYVYQDFDNQLVRPTVLDEACFAPLNYGMADYKEKALRALELCGLTALQHRYIWELSGGQKHLLALAGALSLEPDILVVDEPVSQLDPSHARHVYEVLRRLNRMYGKTIVVIEHHTEFIADYCQDVCLMEQGRVLWKRPVAKALNSLHDLERLGIQPPEATQTAVRLKTLLNGAPSIYSAGEAEMETGSALPASFPITTGEAVKYFSSMLEGAAYATGSGVQNASVLSSKEPSKESQSAVPDATSSKLNGTQHPPADVIRFTGAALNYRTLRKTERTVLQDINLSVTEGERIALIGNNGAGKSSLLKLIAGIAKPSAGLVHVLGQDTRNLSIEELSQQVAFVFQNPEDMFIEDNVRKEIAHCLVKRRYPDAEQTTLQMMRSFRLEDLQERDARLLSGGQQRRVSLAIGAAVRPAVMLLDEPTANLDLATREELLTTLQELDRHVRTVIIATHDMQLVHRWASRVIVMHEGTVAADGPAAEIFADPLLVCRAGLALTQSMELSRALGFTVSCRTGSCGFTGSCGSPDELANALHRLLTRAGKEMLQDAIGAQMVYQNLP